MFVATRQHRVTMRKQAISKADVAHSSRATKSEGKRKNGEKGKGREDGILAVQPPKTF
jgi:hypothetical protein